MTTQQQPSAGPATLAPVVQPRRGVLALRIFLVLFGIAAWWLVYCNLEPFARWLTYGLIGLSAGGHLGAAVEFMVYEAPKVLMLLTLVVCGVGIVRSFFTPERILRKVLKIKLILTFAGVEGLGIMVVGYLFNFVL